MLKLRPRLTHANVASTLARDFKTGQLGGTAAGWAICTKIEIDGGQLGPGDVGFSILVP